MHKSEAYCLERRDDAAKREFWACLALRECPGLALRRITTLLSHFGSAYDAVCAVNAWREAGIPASCATQFKKEEWRKKALLEWVAAKNSQCGIILWGEPEYPVLLRSISDAPPYLYFFGDISLLRNLSVAIVGMRSCSDEGLKATAHIARGLAEVGVTIVSGMAKGIDRAAHLAGLEGAGSSIGVLGAGIDVVYPKPNKDLYGLMHQKGLLISEFPPGFGVDARGFPVRNRIISGLSRAVVVVEAAVRSGSLNTAKHALEQNRELMAVPGPISAASAKGCQELVRRGAKPVFCAEDVLNELLHYLPEHIEKLAVERDSARYCLRPESPCDTPFNRVPAALLHEPSAGLLPWRADTGKKVKAVHPRIARNPNDKLGKGGVITLPAVKTTPGLTERTPPPPPEGVEGIAAEVYAAMRTGPIHIDDICRALGQNAGIVSRIATMFEVQGHAIRLPGMMYIVR